MKTLVLTSALVILTSILTGQTISVNEPAKNTNACNVKVALFAGNDDRVNLIVSKLPEDKLYLKIKNEKGSVVYSKRLTRPESRKFSFDFTDLPEGNYTFQVAKGRELIYSNEVSKG
jgi:hypothetical protein